MNHLDRFIQYKKTESNCQGFICEPKPGKGINLYSELEIYL